MAKRGFTLIEILVVIVIVSVLTITGVNLMNSNSPERALSGFAERLAAQVKFACEQSVFENREYGLLIDTEDYAFVYRRNNSWQYVEHISALAIERPPFFFNPELTVSARPVQLKADSESTPQLICETDGSISPFELKLATTNNQYILRAASPWELTGAWIEE